MPAPLLRLTLASCRIALELPLHLNGIVEGMPLDIIPRWLSQGGAESIMLL